jgi:hypothetical protein
VGVNTQFNLRRLFGSVTYVYVCVCVRVRVCVCVCVCEAILKVDGLQIKNSHHTCVKGFEKLSYKLPATISWLSVTRERTRSANNHVNNKLVSVLYIYIHMYSVNF